MADAINTQADLLAELATDIQTNQDQIDQLTSIVNTLVGDTAALINHLSNPPAGVDLTWLQANITKLEASNAKAVALTEAIKGVDTSVVTEHAALDAQQVAPASTLASPSGVASQDATPVATTPETPTSDGTVSDLNPQPPASPEPVVTSPDNPGSSATDPTPVTPDVTQPPVS